MATSLAQKLKIKEGFSLRTINAPADFKKELGPLPDDVSISPTAKNFEQIHWFILNKAQLDKELPKIMPLVTADVLCWCYYRSTVACDYALISLLISFSTPFSISASTSLLYSSLNFT